MVKLFLLFFQYAVPVTETPFIKGFNKISKQSFAFKGKDIIVVFYP